MNDQPPTGSPQAEAAAPAAMPPQEPAAAQSRPTAASASPPGMAPLAGGDAAPPSTWKTALMAAAATAITMAAVAAGYRFYAEQRVEAAADALTARAYAEVTAPQPPAAAADVAETKPPPVPEVVAVGPPVEAPAREVAAAATAEKAPKGEIARAPALVAAPVAEVDTPAKPTVVAKARPPVRERVAAARTGKPATATATAKARPVRERVASRSAQTERARRSPQQASATPADGAVKDTVAIPAPAKALDVDGIYNARAARECARGLVGMICREWLRASLCLKHHAFGKASICPEERPVREFWSENSNTA